MPTAMPNVTTLEATIHQPKNNSSARLSGHVLPAKAAPLSCVLPVS